MSEVKKTDFENMTSKKKTLCAIAILICGFAYWSTRYKANALLPMISGELNGLTYYSWAPMVFSLTGAIAAPFWGKMGDIYGKKKILLILLALMIAGEGLCFSATNIWFFIAGYAVNGFGAGAMQGTYMALLGQLFPPTERGKIGGTILSVMSVVQLTLPTFSAVISEHWTWRYVFVLTAIIFLITFLFVMFTIPNVTKENVDKRVDILGVIALAISVSNFLLALSWGGSRYKWSSPTIIIMLLITATIWVLFLKHEAKIPEYAVISTKLLKNKSFLMCCLISVTMTFGLTCVATYLSLYVQGVMGVSATICATLEIPAGFIGIFMGTFAGILMDKTKHYKWMLVLAPSCTVGTMLFFGFMPATISLMAIIVVRAFYNICGGSWMPSINTLSAMSYVDQEDYGVGNGTLFFFTSLGNALAPALLGSVLNAAYAKNIASAISNFSLTPKQGSLVSTARVLVNKKSLNQLHAAFTDPSQYNVVVQAVRHALQMSLRTVFLTAAGFICIGVVSALLLKEIPLDQVPYKTKLRK
ncbi:MFS transporter [Clostridium sp. AWRP]|uniref:MFS transporter n=1 Tax=Clostridium sp. AWRP TaxID=2212991 RepID=UPI000FD9475E|nr:MFS transporter [Clostridium sp. AWRP]AZV57666.1 MFS transporter [Clostridium sp. AWRP]